MITYANSVSYFAAGHMLAQVWSQAGETACTAAIAHARRLLSREIGRALRDNEAAYVEGDTTRDEYAVYEQAVHMLANGAIANAEGTAPIPILTGDSADPGSPRKPSSSVYSNEALRWLGWRGTAMIQG